MIETTEQPGVAAAGGAEPPAEDAAKPPVDAAAGNGKSSRRAARKGRLGKSLGSHVDPTAAHFPVSLLSPSEPALLPAPPERATVPAVMSAAAIFWDRDNTLIEDPGYLSDPQQVKLLPGAVEALRQLAATGFQNIIITNQSGIARGMFDEAALGRVHDRLKELLAADGAAIDAIYYCPYLDGPEAVVEQYRQSSDLRKPRPGMLAKASLERQIDLAASWMIGNSLSDTQAGRAAGCRTILLADREDAKDASVDFVAADLAQAVQTVLKYSPGAVMETKTEAVQPSQNDPQASREEPAMIVSALQEILSFLRMVDRRQQAEDFSLGRLVGVVVQMLALAALVWSVFSMIRGEEYGAQIVRLLFTFVLQLLALTCFLGSGKR